MRTIIIANPHKTTLIKVPLFGRMKVKTIKTGKLRGEKITLLIVDEIIELKGGVK